MEGIRLMDFKSCFLGGLSNFFVGFSFLKASPPKRITWFGFAKLKFSDYGMLGAALAMSLTCSTVFTDSS